MRTIVLLTALSLALAGRAQMALVQWAYGPFATPGDAAFIVEGDPEQGGARIYQACGAFGTKGPCLYVILKDQVYHSADAFGQRGNAAFVAEEGRLIRCSGAFCTKGSCALLLEGNKVFRADGAFCNKQEGAFVLDGEDIYLGEGAFCQKGDAILHVRGNVPMIALLTILAGL
jgi:hypothetical protein